MTPPRALALHTTGQLSEPLIRRMPRAQRFRPILTGWAAQCASEGKAPSEVRAQFAQLAATSPSPIVRLYSPPPSSASPSTSAPDLEPLIAHEEDTKDFNLPLMDWYALEPVVGKTPPSVQTSWEGENPILQEYIARRMASTAER